MKKSRGNSTGVDKKGSNQQNISSFFNKNTKSQLFSTIGSTSKAEKKTLNLSTKKQSRTPKAKKSPDVEGPIDEQNRKKEVLTIDHDDLDHQSSSCDDVTAPSCDKNATPNRKYSSSLDAAAAAAAAKSSDDRCASNQPLQCVSGKQITSKNVADDNSDDELIPPTPSPVGLSHSFMKSSFADGDTPRRQAFTNLKLRQVILQKEKEEKRKEMIKMRYSLTQEGSSSMTNASAFNKNAGATSEESFSLQNKGRNFKINGNKNGGNHRIKPDNFRLKSSNKPPVNRNRICRSAEMTGGNTKSPLAASSSEATSLSKDDDKPSLLAPSKIVLKKGKSFKRRASKGNSPTNKRHQGEPPFLLQDSTQLSGKTQKEDPTVMDDIDMAQAYGTDISPAECQDITEDIRDHSFISKMNNNKDISSKFTNIGKQAHAEIMENDSVKGSIDNISGATPNTSWSSPIKGHERSDMDRRLGVPPITPIKTPIEEYERHLIMAEQISATPITPGKTPTTESDGHLFLEEHLSVSPITPGKTPADEGDRHWEEHLTVNPITPGKTPTKDSDRQSLSEGHLSANTITPGKTHTKEFDRHLITDLSLLTPTKNSPNVSRDSLLGVELECLMDGVEWSPMPKKNSARAKLFHEYTPHSSPYRRFLVLEVYRREANRDEALSKYGRVLSEKVLRLFDEGRSEERYCYLRQDWEMTEIEPGDLVHVTGDFDVTSGVCILDNQTDQYIVVHPDTLVSGTTVAGATRCLRRTILNERFRTEDTNEAMLIGTLLHDLFDKAMQAKEFSKEKLVSMAKTMLQQHSYLNSLYSIGMSEVIALDKISECIPAFSDWSKRYILPFPDPDMSLMDYKCASDKTDSTEQPSVCISGLKDIEENVWSPRFGLKGKVDATVEVKIDRRPRIRRHRPDKDNTVQTSVIPLELKTGKLFSKLGSVDHRAQAILYTLLLSDRHHQPVDSGMLYYMKSGHMVGVPALVHEKRALVMRRNEVARYLSLARTTGGLKMPGMLKDLHTCSRCSQAQNCTLFHKSIENGNPTTSGLGELFDKLTQHLTPGHTRYFANWFKLVCLEGKEILQSGKSSQHLIWSMEGLEREALGQCFSGMVNTSRDHQMESTGMYLHCFERSPDHPNQTPLVDLFISTGDRVVVSEERSSAIAMATGYVREVKGKEVIVALDRDLSKCYRSADIIDQTPIYRLDKDEGYNSLVTPWSNMARVLNTESERNAHLRRLIIDLKPPVFARSRQGLINFSSQSSVGSLNTDSQTSSNLSLSSSGTPKYQDTVVNSLMEDLNEDQQRAVKKVLCAQDYTLILGMPGTGKTTTIARLVQILVAQGKSVLLTSYTHTAVDNILLKIKQAGLDFLRLGQAHKLLPEIQPYSTEVAAADIKTVTELRDFYASKAVVATTCLGVNHALFSQRSFDYCIVDEASQITQPVCLGPLRHADVFVLVGDHYQLPPLVQSLEAREGGMDVSLFKRLSEHHPQAVVCLEHQYRMNQDVMALSNTLIYEERLKCGTPQVANALLDIPQLKELMSWFSVRTVGTSDNWLLHALDPAHPVVFLNTDQVPGYESRNGHLVSNETEATLIQQLTCALRLGGVASSSIGIISPYRQQLKLIKELLPSQNFKASSEDLEINTVDKYQGRDKPCILVSLVRSNDTSSVGDLLKDWRRVNVAVTRAKTKLILIGSLSTLRASLLLNELIDLLEKNNWIFELPKDAHKMFVDLVPLEETDSQNSKKNREQLTS